MVPYAALLPELEQAIRHGSVQKRADMAERVTDLFLAAADHFDPQQSALFDQILLRLIEEVEQQARAGISSRLAPLESAPVHLVRRLARDLDVTVAGPMLRQSPRLTDGELVAVAQNMGPPHLVAIAQRAIIAPPVTDVLVERGDRGVLHTVAENRGARFSRNGFKAMVGRTVGDDRLAETVGLRPDISTEHLRELLGAAPDIVRRRLLAAARAARTEISQALTDISKTVENEAGPKYRNAQRNVLTLMRQGALDEAHVRAAAVNGRFEDTVAMLAALSQVPIETVARLARSERLDGVLILGRALGIEWPTMRAVIILRSGVSPGPRLEEARSNFERLSRVSAERVVRFWRGSRTKSGEVATGTA